MARDNRKIVSGVWVGGQMYTDGMQDELEAALTPAMVEHLTAKGAIEGDWNVKPAKKAKADAEPAPAAPSVTTSGEPAKPQDGQKA